MVRVLDVGCGWKKINGAVSVDIRTQTTPSVCGDMDVDGRSGYFPFRDDSFDEVYILQTIDHFRNIVPVMEEVHRVARKGAKVIITVAHVS
ncbi:MAG: methyltransferase domain-containing protein, partial [Nitrospinaceae bacterium]|nr:methyltransferase domain-containing protein [Nitrospinaceae bacterium]